MQQHLQTMLRDILAAFDAAVDFSHYGVPEIVTHVQSGGRGAPRICINRDWLAWAVHHRTTSGIATFLQVSRTVVRKAILEYGLKQQGAAPFPHEDLGELDAVDEAGDGQGGELDAVDEDHTYLLGDGYHGLLFDPIAMPPLPEDMAADDSDSSHAEPEQHDPSNETHTGFTPMTFSGPLSTFSDQELDNTILRLRSSYRRAGVTILDGMLRRLGLPVGRERIRRSLLRIDPVQRVFDRIRIRRRKYQVAGPNALWHHDGQHGLFFLFWFHITY